MDNSIKYLGLTNLHLPKLGLTFPIQKFLDNFIAKRTPNLNELGFVIENISMKKISLDKALENCKNLNKIVIDEVGSLEIWKLSEMIDI